MIAAKFEAIIVSRLEEVVCDSVAHVCRGGIPFSAAILNQDGRVVGRGVNKVLENHDPTAHAEIEAIREAGRCVGRTNLSGMILLASGEPCALCYMSALYSGITRIVFAVDRHEAAACGFDYRHTYALLAGDPLVWGSPRTEKIEVKGALNPFRVFLKSSGGAR